MSIVVNGRFLARRMTGIERYGQEVLQHLGNRLRVIRPGHRWQGRTGHVWEQLILPGRIRAGEMLWSPANTGPLSVSNQILTIHDLSVLEHPEWFNPAFSSWYRLFLPILARRVRRILVPSDYVRQKVLQRFSLPARRVVAISSGVDMQEFHPLTCETEKYILFVGTLEPRKNLPGLLRAWETVKDRHPDVSLLIAGAAGKVFRPVTLPASLERVQFLGYVPESDLPALYARAMLFILPSFDEGFGLPVLEAQASGTPVLAAQAGALPEVAGEAGLFFDPQNPFELAGLIDCCLGDPQIRKNLREKGLERAQHFPWQKTAEKIWQEFEALALV